MVEDQNVQKLSDAILQLASSPDLLHKFSQNSLLYALKYQPEQILQIWTEKVFKG